MISNLVIEQVEISSLVDAPFITEWRDYSKPLEYLKNDMVDEDGIVTLFKFPYCTLPGAVSIYPEKRVLLNGKAPLDIIRQLKREHTIACIVVPGVNDENLKEFVNILNKERNLKDWEKCEKALAFLPAQKQGQNLGGKTRWAIAIEIAGVDISEDTLDRYTKVKEYDKETNQEYKLIGKIKGNVQRVNQDGKELPPLPIKTAHDFVLRRTKKKEVLDNSTNDIVIPGEDYYNIAADYLVWHGDNKRPWNMNVGSIQLITCSPHYFNQRKYTDAGVPHKPLKLEEFLEELRQAFVQGYIYLRDDGVLVINIADSYKNGKNYIVIVRLCQMLCDEIGFHFLFKQVWYKDGGLLRGHEEVMPNYDYEEILYFSKTPKYYYNPIKYYERQTEIELGYFNGRQNPDGSYTTAKWTASKEYSTFNQFISNKHFEHVIISANGGADSKKINDKYGLKHPAIMPLVIPLYPILCYSKPGDVVFDPWAGTGTTLKVALALGRTAYGMDLEKKFADISNQELRDIKSLFV